MRTKVPAELKLTFNFERLGLDYRQVKAEKLTVEFPDFVEFEEGQEGLSGNRLSLDGLVFVGVRGIVFTYFKGDWLPIWKCCRSRSFSG